MSDMQMLNVRAFGAQGDGATDDTKALQDALDVAAESKGAVFIPPGIFLSSSLKVPAHVALLANPTWGYRDCGGTVIRLIDKEATCLLDLTYAIGVTLNGLCLDGAGLGEEVHGILFNKEDYGKQEDTPRIERCRINNFTGDGIHLKRIWCFSIRGCMVSWNRGDGLRLRGWDGFILDNWFSANGRAGFGAYEENASITMTGNRIEWNQGGGIVVHGGGHYNITGNYIDRSGGAGISLLPRGNTPCRVFSITGNLIYRSGAPQWRELEEYESTHVHFESVRGMTFSGNTMHVGRDDQGKGEWSPNYAMVCGGLEDAVIKDNVMYQGATGKLVLDLGGHHENVIIKDNVGSLFAPSA